MLRHTDEFDLSLDLQVIELKNQLKALAQHWKLVIEPGYVDKHDVYRQPQVRKACKECKK